MLTLVGQNVAIVWLQRLMHSTFHAFVFNPGGVAGMVRSLETAQEQIMHGNCVDEQRDVESNSV